jgi:hypothetical protein
MTDTAEQFRAELEEVFSRAEYPVEEPMELVPVLPDGPSTTFEAGEISVGVMDLGAEYAEYQDYPYETADALVDDLMHGFREEGLFD